MAEDESSIEIVTFQLPEAYVYAIPPTASHSGHRAESWNVDKWLKTVSVKVTNTGKRGHIKLFDTESGQLFAECPLPRDVPVSTVVEPVIDSSRYFVLRVEDEATRRHAFVGLGFRERDSASDFKLAVQEHEQQQKREKEAAKAREEYERELAEAQASGATAEGGKLHDYSLKGTVKISVPKKAGAAAASKGSAGAAAAAAATGAGVGILPPPPGGFKLAPPPAVGAGMLAPAPGAIRPPTAAAPPLPVAPAEQGWASFDNPGEGSDDDWADFQS